MKRRVRAMFLALLMVFSTIFTVVTPAEVKADGTKTVIIHYNREDGNYDGWDVWHWNKDANDGMATPFSYSDDFGKVCVIQRSGDLKELGFIIRTEDWSKDYDQDQFITVAGDVTEVWINSGVEGYKTEAPEGATPFDTSQLAGGGGSGDKEPEVQAPAEGQIQVKLHYHRFDQKFDGWNVWFWPEGADGTGNPFSGEDDFGKIVSYNVDASAGQLGFIIRLNEWEAKDVDADRYLDLSKATDGVIEVWIVQGDSKIYTDLNDIDLSPKMLSASLTTAKRIAVKTTMPVDTDATESLSIFKVVDEDGKAYEIMNLFSESTPASEFNINMKQPLDLNKKYTIVSETFGSKAITYGDVYNTEEFEEAFYYDGNDLGAVYSADSTTFKVWAPFASAIKLNLYKEGLEGDAYEVVDMTKGEKGVWSVKVDGDLNGVYYTYSVTNDETTSEVVDLYARTTGANGKRGMVIDLSKTNPENWDKDVRPVLLRATDSIIYEMHVRDFTIDESSGVKNKGKYLGLVEKGTKNSAGVSTGLDHIVDLGVTHVQLIPVYDYSPNSVDETKLDKPQFNWGYDPYNYNAPEGSYSTDPFNGEVRVNEFKQMVQGFHSSGLRVIMDVVYNHTAESANSYMNLTVPGYYYRMKEDGSFSNGSGCGNEVASERAMVRKYIVDSVTYWASEYHLDGFRFDLMALIDMETIKQVRTELDKIDPSIIILGEGWTGGGSLLGANEQSLKKNTYKFEEMQVAAFSDDIRDGIKGSVFLNTDAGFASGKIGQEERIKSGIIAATKYPGISWADTHTDISSPWAASPQQVINYVSAHDNLTLWDKIALSNKDDSEEDKIKVNLLSASIVYTAQGIPFMLSGEEMLRSKDGDHNSYKSSDAINSIKWDNFTNTEVYEYYKGLIQFRKNHAGLRMTTTEDVSKYLKFIDTPSQVVGFTIDGAAEGEVADQLLIIYNASKEAKEVTIPEGTWNVCIKDNKAGIAVIETVSGGKISVSPISTLALVQGETEDANAVGSTTTTTPDASTDSNDSKDEKSGNFFKDNLVIILVVAAVAVVAIIAVVAKKSGKKSSTSAVDAEVNKILGESAAAPAPAPAAEPVVEAAPAPESPVAESPVAEAPNTDDTTV